MDQEKALEVLAKEVDYLRGLQNRTEEQSQLLEAISELLEMYEQQVYEFLEMWERMD